LPALIAWSKASPNSAGKLYLQHTHFKSTPASPVQRSALKRSVCTSLNEQMLICRGNFVNSFCTSVTSKLGSCSWQNAITAHQTHSVYATFSLSAMTNFPRASSIFGSCLLFPEIHLRRLNPFTYRCKCRRERANKCHGMFGCMRNRVSSCST